MRRSLIYIALLSVLAQSCTKSDNLEPFTTGTITVDELQSTMTDFQWKLFRQTVMECEPQDNILISPFSIASAMYMALEGAAGSTKVGMMQGLSLDYQENESVSMAYHELVKQLRQITGAVDLNIVNGIFYDQNRVVPADTFMLKMNEAFEADDFALDFGSEASPEKINDWVADKTKDKIEKIIKEIKAEDIMFLINAIHLKADWDSPFAPEQTYQGSFTSADGTEQRTPFMWQDGSDNHFFQNDKWQLVEKSLADTNYSMVLLQPTEKSSLSDQITDLKWTDVEEFLGNVAKERSILHLPKFEITYEKELSTVLKGLGITEAFSPFEANFSKLGTAGGNIYLSRVQHKSFLSVDEKGVEGAAVTSVTASATSLPPTFRFDGPFVYIIRNRVTNTFLFIGKLESIPQ